MINEPTISPPAAAMRKQELDTVNAVLGRAVAHSPDKVALDFLDCQLTYREIDELSTRLAHGLSGLGVKRGQTVASLLDNNADAVLTWLAINKLGAISVPINTAYRGDFLRHQIADCGAQVVLMEHDYVERLAAVASELPALRYVVCRGNADVPLPPPARLVPIAQVYAENRAPLDVDVAPDDLAMLIYTAGTTGPSKGCMVSHNYACNLAWQSVMVSGRTAEDVTWTPLPLFHMNAVASTVLSTFMVGGTAAISPRFSVTQFWPEIERTKATIVAILGAMIPFIADAPDTEVSKRCYGQIRTVVGAPFTGPLQDKWRTRFGVRNAGANIFGLTECAVVTSHPLSEPAPPGSSGRRNEWFDVRIVDDREIEVPEGRSGEIVVRPLKPHVMFEGYWHRPEDTLKLLKNLWFHTGDIGKFDADGFLYFVDRKKDYLRRRGENISSFEMESTFRSHPAIQDVAVHAVFSEAGEDDVKVTAVLNPEADLSEEALCLWAIERIPYFAVPRYIEFRKDLPRNPVGRVLKYQLRDDGCTPSTWDREKSNIQLQKR